MSTPDTLRERLAAILAELASHPDGKTIAAEAADAAMVDCNGFDERADITGLALAIATGAADWQAADCDELAGYWEREAEAPLDITADEARDNARYYAAHAAAHANTAEDLRRLSDRHARAVKLAEDLA